MRPHPRILLTHTPLMRRNYYGTSALAGLQALGDSNGYLTGPSVRSPWLRAFRVLLELPTDLKRARQALRERGWGVAAVKSRYPGVEPARLQRELGASGEPVTVVAWPEGRSRRIAAIVREDP